MHRNKTLPKAIVAIAVVAFAQTAYATPISEMIRHSIEGSSVMRSEGGGIELSATVGQAGDAVLSGGGIELTGGFWHRLSPMDCDEDGSVGYVDSSRFMDCVTGPAGDAPDECHCFDVNASDTVDLLDWGVLQREFNDTAPPPGDPDVTAVTGVVRLLDPEGDVVAGATVELIGKDRVVLTDQDGVFVFGDVSTIPPLVDVVTTATIGGEDLFGAARFVKPFRGGTTDVGIIVLSNIVRWVSPTDGLWVDEPNWEAFFRPGPGHSTIIDVPDAEVTVTHNNTVPFDGPLGSLVCNEKLRLETFGTFSVAGLFQMNSTLEMTSATLVDSTVDLGPGGLINILTPGAPTFDGVTVNGNMDLLDGNLAALRIRDGLTINGTVRMTGLASSSSGSRMLFEGPNKFIDGDATIFFVANSGMPQIFQNDRGSLHIRHGVTIRGARGFIGRGDAPLTNDGVIHSDAPGIIRVDGADWVNNGTARVSGSGSELWLRHQWTNHGTIEATNAGRLVLGESGHTYESLGNLIATDADVRLFGDFRVADLGTFAFSSSLVVIEGTLFNDTGLAIDAGNFNWKLGRGTIIGGTISSADGTPLETVPGVYGSRTSLNGVTLNADLHMFTAQTHVNVDNGLTLHGTIRINGSQLRFDRGEKTVGGTGRIELLGGGNAVWQESGTFEIGSGIAVHGSTGSVGDLFGTLINNGTIHADAPGTVTVSGTDWVNRGTLRSSGGGFVNARGDWTNKGTVLVEAASSLTINGVLTNDGT
ncbi:MAG: hypothetical protein PVI86_12460, partial [Phycisphaerae bacterium]